MPGEKRAIVLVVGDLESKSATIGEEVAFHRHRPSAELEREHHQAAALRGAAGGALEEAAVGLVAGERAAALLLPAGGLELEELRDPLLGLRGVLQRDILERPELGEPPLEAAVLLAPLGR